MGSTQWRNTSFLTFLFPLASLDLGVMGKAYFLANSVVFYHQQQAKTGSCSHQATGLHHEICLVIWLITLPRFNKIVA